MRHDYRLPNYSPRQRGCFTRLPFANTPHLLFPASAGVFPFSWFPKKQRKAIPRVSGGVSHTPASPHGVTDYSPRQRGCFHQGLRYILQFWLFPASAGVFPFSLFVGTNAHSIPRVSGGVSKILSSCLRGMLYSPRQRGCFQGHPRGLRRRRLFPASAGVFLQRIGRDLCIITIPRVSGGVSTTKFLPGSFVDYSPRQRGCFLDDLFLGARFGLFPASAGVFPRADALIVERGAIPRVSGGVSFDGTVTKTSTFYSPRQRGCFLLGMLPDLEFIAISRVSGGGFRDGPHGQRRDGLFPASAGVFPRRSVAR